MSVGTRHAGGRPVTETRTKFGEKVERLANRCGKPLDVVAEESGIALSSLYRMMSGKISSPRWTTLERLAGCLGVKVETLMK